MSRQFKEIDVTIRGNVNLQGTLALPDETGEPVPGVLILPGSGPVDRDGNMKKPRLHLNLYKALSDMLVPMGFAALRYDKRGVGESEGEFLKAGMWDLVEDAEAALEHLKSHPQVDAQRTVIMGHSEGCILAVALSARQPQPIQGLVLLAGSAETLKDAFARQRSLVYKELQSLKGLKGFLVRLFKVPEKAEKQAQDLMQKIQLSKTDTVKYKLKTINAKWHREHFAYNVLEDLQKVSCPLLAITGSKDMQANPDCVPKIGEMVGNHAEGHIIENMNHMLRLQEEDVSMLRLPKLYKRQSGQPLHPELQPILGEWLHKHDLG